MTSQKFPEFVVVPWKNSEEWKSVYTSIFDENTSKLKQLEALDQILMWQKRIPLLPSGIEGTLCILEALLVDENSLTERQCRSFYSSCIMRFLNICVANRAQLLTFTKTVRSNSIPDWIVRIRHDFAHSQKLPSIELLKLAINECFKWLKVTYWDAEMMIMKDYYVEDLELSQAPRKLFNLYCDLLIYLMRHQDFPMEKRKEIEYATQLDICNLSRFKIMETILDSIEVHVDDLKKEDWDYIFEQFVVECLFNTPRVVFDKNNSRSTYQLFENVFLLFHRSGQIINFVVQLINIINCEITPNHCSENKVLTSLWLNEIFKGYLKNKFVNDKSKYEGIEGIGINFNDCCLENIENLRRLKYLILENIEQTNNYIDSYYLLVYSARIADAKPFLQEIQKANIPNIKVLNDIDDCGSLSEQIPYYKPELYSLLNEESMDVTLNTDILDNIDNSRTKRNRWSIVKDTTNYERCAIGILPY